MMSLPKTALFAVAMLFGHAAQAADLRHEAPHHHARRWTNRFVEQNNVIHCTTSNVFGLFSYSNCGQGFDPLGSASN